MNRFVWFMVFVLGMGLAFGANKVYRYRCPKCKLIQEYEIPGSKKCPNDGRMMIRISGSFTGSEIWV